MGKGLVVNSLSYGMSNILQGKVSVDDIDKIYAQTCFTKDTMSKLLSEYDFYWKDVARIRAEEEICKKYGVKDLWDLEDGEMYSNLSNEVKTRTDELIPQVLTEAETLLHKLWDEGRIIQTRYRVPEGQTVKAKVFPGHEWLSNGEMVETVEVTGKGQGRYDEILDLNGEYYYSYNTAVASMGIQGSGFFNNEIELIANQLFKGYSWNDRQKNTDRLFVFQKLFPQYKEAIAKVGAKLDIDSIRDIREQDVLEMLQEALKDRGEHTAEEIGQGIADLKKGDLGDGLKNITDRTDRTGKKPDVPETK